MFGRSYEFPKLSQFLETFLIMGTPMTREELQAMMANMMKDFNESFSSINESIKIINQRIESLA